MLLFFLTVFARSTVLQSRLLHYYAEGQTLNVTIINSLLKGKLFIDDNRGPYKDVIHVFKTKRLRKKTLQIKKSQFLFHVSNCTNIGRQEITFKGSSTRKRRIKHKGELMTENQVQQFVKKIKLSIKNIRHCGQELV